MAYYIIPIFACGIAYIIILLACGIAYCIISISSSIGIALDLAIVEAFFAFIFGAASADSFFLLNMLPIAPKSPPPDFCYGAADIFDSIYGAAAFFFIILYAGAAADLIAGAEKLAAALDKPSSESESEEPYDYAIAIIYLCGALYYIDS